MSKFPKYCCLALLFLCSFQFIQAQSLDYVQGELLVQFTSNQRPEDLVAEYERKHGQTAALTALRKLKAPMAIWKFTFDFNSIGSDELIRQMDRLK